MATRNSIIRIACPSKVKVLKFGTLKVKTLKQSIHSSSQSHDSARSIEPSGICPVVASQISADTLQPNLRQACTRNRLQLNELKPSKTETNLLFEKIPGPKPSLPLIGTNWIYLPMVGHYKLNKLHEASMDKFLRYGPIVKEEFVPGKPFVHIFDPTDIREVFKREEGCPSRPVLEHMVKQRTEDTVRYSNVGLGNMTGKEWTELRAQLTPLMMSDKFKASTIKSQNRISSRMIHYIENQLAAGNGNILEDIQSVLSRYAVESIMCMAVSDRITCLDYKAGRESFKSDGEKVYKAAMDFFKAQHQLFYGTKIWKYIETKPYKELRACSDLIHDTTSVYTDEILQQLEAENQGFPSTKNPKCDNDYESLTETLFRTGRFSNLDIKSTTTDFISGGIYTVSSTLTMALFLLATNPECQQKLYEEIERVFPDQSNLDDIHISSDRLEQLKYLKMCVKETYRLLPTIPGVARTLQNDLILSNYHVPKGTLVFCNSLVTCRSPLYFDNPMQFNPNRWERSATTAQQRNNLVFALLPFGHGVRKCIGRVFAEMEIYIAITKIIRAFEIEAMDGESVDNLELEFNFIVAPKNPISLRVRRRKQASSVMRA